MRYICWACCLRYPCEPFMNSCSEIHRLPMMIQYWIICICLLETIISHCPNKCIHLRCTIKESVGRFSRLQKGFLYANKLIWKCWRGSLWPCFDWNKPWDWIQWWQIKLYMWSVNSICRADAFLVDWSTYFILHYKICSKFLDRCFPHAHATWRMLKHSMHKQSHST